MSVGLGPLGPCAKLCGSARVFPSKVCLYKCLLFWALDIVCVGCGVWGGLVADVVTPLNTCGGLRSSQLSLTEPRVCYFSWTGWSMAPSSRPCVTTRVTDADRHTWLSHGSRGSDCGPVAYKASSLPPPQLGLAGKLHPEPEVATLTTISSVLGPGSLSVTHVYHWSVRPRREDPKNTPTAFPSRGRHS